MSSPVCGRSQKPMLLKLKQGLHVVSLVALCIWLIYRIQQLNAHKHDSNRNLHRSILGRKVNMGRITRRRSSDVEGVAFFDITGIPLTVFQEGKLNEYFMEKAASIANKDLRGDSAKSRNPLRLVQENQVILESTVHITRKSRHSEVEDGSKAQVKRSTTGAIRERAVPLGLVDKNEMLTDSVYIHPKHQQSKEEYRHGDAFDDENGIPPGLVDIYEHRHYE